MKVLSKEFGESKIFEVLSETLRVEKVEGNFHPVAVVIHEDGKLEARVLHRDTHVICTADDAYTMRPEDSTESPWEILPMFRPQPNLDGADDNG